MKKAIIFITLLAIATTTIFSTVTAQVIKVDSLRINELCDMTSVITTSNEPGLLYNRTIKWINEYYQNPKTVIIGSIENQSISILGANAYPLGTGKNGEKPNFNLFYHIYFTYHDSLVIYRFSVDKFGFDGHDEDYHCDGFYKKKGGLDFIKDFMESAINDLLFSYVNKLSTSKLSSEEALSQLKKAKEKLDLQLITQEEYDKLKAELLPFIK